MSNLNWTYDEATGRYIVKGARILFPNFEGHEDAFNQNGKRNFRLQLSESLAEELKSRGAFVRERPPRNEDEDPQYLVKIGVYKNSDIRVLSGKVMTALTPETFVMVDREFQRGHVANGDIDLEFHVARNTRIASAPIFISLDTAIIPVRKSRLLEDYEDYEED